MNSHLRTASENIVEIDNPLKYTDPSGYRIWPFGRRRKNVPMFQPSSYESSLPSHKETKNDNDDGGNYVDPYRDDSATGVISGLVPGGDGAGSVTPFNSKSKQFETNFFEPTVLHLLKTYHKSYLQFRREYHNKQIHHLQNKNTSEIAHYIYETIFLEPDISVSPESEGINAIVNFVIVRQGTGVDNNGVLVGEFESYSLGCLIIPEMYPYFSFAANEGNPHSIYHYNHFIIYTNKGIFGFQIQWVIPPLLYSDFY